MIMLHVYFFIAFLVWTFFMHQVPPRGSEWIPAIILGILWPLWVIYCIFQSARQ